MSAIRILILCVSAALICASLRMAHPQIATAVALAAGIAALMLSVDDMGKFAEAIETLERYAVDGRDQSNLLRVCGIAMIAEFASGLCRDAGEAALAQRIDMGVKLGIAATVVPVAAQIMEQIAELLT